MTEKEFIKYGYYFRDDNLRVSKVLVAQNMQEIDWLEDWINSKAHFIKTNSSVELIDDYMVMFFNLFTNVKVNCVFYSLEEKNLCFLGMSRNLTEEEIKKYQFLCSNEESLHSKYFISMEDFLNTFEMVDQNKKIKGQTISDFVCEFQNESFLKNSIHEVTIDKYLTIHLLGNSIYDIVYKGKTFTKKDYEKAMSDPRSKEAKTYQKVKDKTFSVFLLENDMKDQLIKEEEPVLKKKIQ